MQTILIFVRHGESEGNKSSRFNGSLNLPLTERGQLQASKTALYLKKFKIDKVYASDLSRAAQTGKTIAEMQNCDIVFCKELREIFGGDFEGQLYDDLRTKFPKEFGIWLNDLGNCVCPNGESIKDLLKRFNDKIISIVNENIGKTIVIATHAMPIRVMSTVWSKKDITKVRDFEFVRNASVTVVDYTDINNPEVLVYDEAEHLGELVTELPHNV